MATFLWSALNDRAEFSFDPAVDVLHFDDPGISAASIRFGTGDTQGALRLIAQGKTVNLIYTITGPGVPITTSNITFANGSQVLAGDNTISQADDYLNNTLSGTIHNDFLISLGGDELLNGNDGDDVFWMAMGQGRAPEGPRANYGNDTINGGNGVDRILFIEDPNTDGDLYLGTETLGGVTVDLALGTASGGNDAGIGSVAFTSIEAITGTKRDDIIQGNSADNFFEGLGSNDSLTGRGGNDTLDGGAGTDTAVYSGVRSNFTVTKTTSGYTVTDTTGTEGSDTLVGVERLQFSDFSLALDVDGNAGQAYRLYKAALNRAPDQGGLGFQMNTLDNGASLSQVAQNFIASPEFSQTYGALDNTQFVNLLYQNVLGRSADASGLVYHTDRLSSGTARADVLVGFSESPENKAALIGVIQDGMVYTL